MANIPPLNDLEVARSLDASNGGMSRLPAGQTDRHQLPSEDVVDFEGVTFCPLYVLLLDFSFVVLLSREQPVINRRRVKNAATRLVVRIAKTLVKKLVMMFGLSK